MCPFSGVKRISKSGNVVIEQFVELPKKGLIKHILAI